MARFHAFSVNLNGAPALRRALLLSLCGIVILCGGGLLATILMIVAIYRLLFAGLEDGAVTMLSSMGIFILCAVIGVGLLRLGSKRAASAAQGSMAGSGSGVVVDGEVVSSEPTRRDDKTPLMRRE